MKHLCPVCGKEFAPNPSRPQKQYCSLRCGYLAAHRKQRGVPVSEEAFRAYQEKRQAELEAKRHRTCKCAVCGKEFAFRPNNPNARFCSRSCANRARGASFSASRNISASKARHAEPNITFVQKREQVDRDSVARVMAYLSLPASERWARRDTLTQKERSMASDMWMKIKCSRPVAMAN